MWEGARENNFLHLAANVNHERFIRRLICTQDTDEIDKALLGKNIDGHTPGQLTQNQRVRRLLAWVESQHRYYPLITQPRVVVFFSSQDRPGSDGEKDSIVGTLSKLKIDSRVKENPTQRDVYVIIRANQTGEVSALIVVVMSHGDSGTVAVADGNMQINNILKQMNPQILTGVPKVTPNSSCYFFI